MKALITTLIALSFSVLAHAAATQSKGEQNISGAGADIDAVAEGDKTDGNKPADQTAAADCPTCNTPSAATDRHAPSAKPNYVASVLQTGAKVEDSKSKGKVK